MAENRFTDGNKITIPLNVSESFKSSIGAKNNLNLKRLSPEAKEWCNSQNITPPFLWEYYVSKGLDYFEHPICPNCKSILPKEKLLHKVEYRFCCEKCRFSSIGSQLALEKRKKTNFEKYGVENVAKTDWATQKRKKTNLKKYGVAEYTQTEEYKKKSKETSLERYGTESPNQSEVVKKRKEESCLKNFGAKNPFESEIIQAKIIGTNLKRYGATNPNKSKEVREKIRQTNQERYGCDCYSFQDKAMRENMFTQSLIQHRTKYYETFLKGLKKRNISLLSDKEQYINGDFTELKCEICGTVWKEEKTNPRVIFCPHCDHSQSSCGEKEILQFVKSLGFDCVANERNILDGKELDVYIPEKKIAFEYDGNYWHNSSFKDKNYHQKKTLECKERGIRLIHIFEYEWETKRDKLENLIKSALGMFEKRIYARNCEVKEIDSETYKDFLDEYHIQDSINSPIRYGLFDEDELVSVIGFGKSRFKKDEIELHRYCVKNGYSIIGGFSKLIKHSGIKNFISFVDLAHFSGEGYKKLGFKEIEITKPNYVYVKEKEVLTRIVCQKHKLVKVLGENFDEKLSETENMVLNGWNKIYDCGNLKMCYNS